jgi:hypothetical protein
MTALSQGAIGLVMSLVMATGGVAERQQQTPAGPLINGRLVDNETRKSIAQGAIQLLLDDTVLVETVLTDGAGQFRLSPAKAGTFRLRAERLGYQTALSPRLTLQQNDTLGVDFHLSAKAILLSPIIVKTSARPHLAQYEAIGMGDFYRRMMRWERGGSGTFMTRALISSYENGGSTSRMLTRANGVNLDGTGAIMMRDRCSPRYYLNGVPYTIMGGTLDTLFPPEMLEAVEVYVGSAVPGDFFGGNCGVIALWTRRT